MRREAAPDARRERDGAAPLAQRSPTTRRPRVGPSITQNSAPTGSVRSDRPATAQVIAPRPGVHPYLPALVPLPGANQHRRRVADRDRTRSATAPPGSEARRATARRSSPHPPNPVPVGRDLAHNSDDLIDRRRIGRIPAPCSARPARVMAGHRRWRPSPAGDVEQLLRRHRSLPSRANWFAVCSSPGGRGTEVRRSWAMVSFDRAPCPAGSGRDGASVPHRQQQQRFFARSELLRRLRTQ